MRCKKIQELLKSDYLDGELSLSETGYIREHLKKCPQCRGLEKQLQAQRMLFQGIKQQKVPERVWQNIRDAIVTERLNQEAGVTGGILGRLKELIFNRRPAFALASVFSLVILLLVFAGISIHRNQVLSNINNEEISFDYNLDSENYPYDLGTNIEQCFL